MTIATDPKANAQTWANALRSGEYVQTREACRLWDRNRGHCCLGVAADLVVKAGEATWLGDNLMELETNDGSCGAALTPKAQGMFGLDERLMWRYVSLNDTNGFTFNEIAEVVERSLVGTEHIETVITEITNRKEQHV